MKKKTTKKVEKTKKVKKIKKAEKKVVDTKKTEKVKTSSKAEGVQEEEEKNTETEEESTETQEDTGKEEQTIGDIVEEEGLVSEPNRDSMLGKEKTPELSEIIMRIDKIDGKLDLFKGMIDSFSERLIDLNEKLGDTRRMVFDREKWASKLETDFDKVSSIVKELDPEKIVLKFERFKTNLDKQEASTTRLDELLINLTERIKNMEDSVSNIKSLKNIMKAAEDVSKKIKEIEKTKNYGDKLAAKVESMFMEVNERVGYLKENLNKIETHDTMLTDLTKETDTMKFQIDQELVKKKDADKLIDSVKDIIVEEIVGINPAAFENLRKRVAIMENLKKSDKKLEEEMKKYSVLLDQVERDFQMGRIKDETYTEIKSSTQKKIEEIKFVIEKRGENKQPEKKEKPRKLKERLLESGKTI